VPLAQEMTKFYGGQGNAQLSSIQDRFGGA
jgi:hypothetical protein